MFSGSAPAAPSNLQVAAISGTQTQRTWTETSTDEDGYQVDRMLGTSGTFSPVAALPPGSTQYVDTVPTAGSTYTYEVEATNFVANSAWSSQVAVTMPVLPNPITNALPTVVTATSVAMTWTNNGNNGTQIRIFYLTVAGGGNPTFVTALPPSATSYTATGLLPGVSYTFHVQVGNLAGYANYAVFIVQTLTNPPTQLLAVPANHQVTLTWVAPSGAENFNIYRGTTSGGESLLASGVTGSPYVDTTATNGTTYFYEVTAVDNTAIADINGESARSAESSALPQVPASVPTAPTGLSATPGDGTVLLTWQGAVGAATYNIYRGTSSGGEALVYTGATNSPPITAPTFTDTGLTDGTTYYYKITGVNPLGEGPKSSEISAVPQVVVPQAPINVTATPGNSQVGLSWSNNRRRAFVQHLSLHR